MEKLEIMQQVLLFRDLDKEDLSRLAEIATEERFPMGYQIFAEGTVGDSLYIVKYGTAAVLKNVHEEDEEMAHMGCGQHFGEMALISDETRSATIKAVERTELIRIKRQDLERLLAQDPALAHRVYRAIARYLCGRLRETTAELAFIKEAAKRHVS
jgi:CRP/FNR family cyclic AMP-dependent transcriptional regulator